MAVIQVRHLTHTFPDGTTAIEDISTEISEGEFIVVAGANGSGKTVFVRHLNGLLTPTAGEVLIDGTPISKDITAARKRIGLIFQDSDSQIVGQTVEEDVAFGPENLRLSVEEVEKRVKEALSDVGLTPYAKQNPHVLSGGQKRKLAVAGVLAMRPQFIMFDEPFTGLDYLGVVQVLKQILKLHQSGHTIILVTHELEKVLAHATRLMIVFKGKIVEDGLPCDVIGKTQQYGVRMPLSNGEKVEALTWLE